MPERVRESWKAKKIRLHQVSPKRVKKFLKTVDNAPVRGYNKDTAGNPGEYGGRCQKGEQQYGKSNDTD